MTASPLKFKWSRIFFPPRGRGILFTPISVPIFATFTYLLCTSKTLYDFRSDENRTRITFEGLHDFRPSKGIPTNVLNYYQMRQHFSYEREMLERQPFPWENMTAQQKREWYLERLMDPEQEIRY